MLSTKDEIKELREHTLLRIGEFAQIGQVSIATLHHYEKSDILHPSELDPNTGYRYYSLDQLARLHRIIAFKELGFSLQQIARLLEENLSLEQLQGMFRLKEAQTLQIIEAEQARLARIAARLRQIEKEGNMTAYEIRLKQVDPLLVASVRERVSIEDSLEQQYEKISSYLAQQGVPYSEPHLLLRHSRFKMSDNGLYADLELAVPLHTELSGNELINVRTLPACQVACTIDTRNASSLGQAYMALSHWMDANGYRFSGPPREVHLQQSVTEVQFPVEKQDR